jgi:ABC-type Mn2+/Zn2+ transport system permease subunit
VGSSACDDEAVQVLTDPWSWWVEPFTANPFMRNALWAGLLVAACTSIVGTWVVLRGMAFLGDALAHGVLPGIAIAFVLGVNTTIGAFVAALVMVLGINFVRSSSSLPEDTSIGVLFVGFLALAVVVMSASSGAYSGDLNRFLFGSVTGVDTGDLGRQAITTSVALAGVAVFYRAFLVMTFDETQAQLLGLRPRLAHVVLLVLLALTIVASFEVVGNLLVFAFLVAPPAAATLLVRRVPWIMVTALVLGSLSVVVGLLISYHRSTAAGATMALVSVAVFVGVLAVNGLRHNLRAGSKVKLS